MATNGPSDQSMNDEGHMPMGSAGWGSDIAKTMDNKHAFTIKHMVPRAGCCYYPTLCGMCNPALKGRGYLVIGDNFFEKNDPIALGVCCCTMDVITKVYYDRQPFAETFCEKWCDCLVGDGSDNFVTEHDMCYCCYCIPCMPVYDLCNRPCAGGTLGRATCSRDKACCFLIGTRCCGPTCISPIAGFLDDSKAAKETLEKQLNVFRAGGGGAVSGV